MRPRTILSVAAAGSALLLAGCGGPTQASAPADPLARGTGAGSTSTGSTQSTPPTSQEQQHQSGPPKCTAADVRGVFGPGDSVYSGTTQLSIIATNTSDHTCSIHGYGGLEIRTGGDGAALHLKLTRETKPAAATVTLEPGQKAYKKVAWNIARDDDEAASCAQGGSYAFVILPDDTKTFEVHPADGSEELADICGGEIRGYAWSATDQTEEG
jgi:uncharacterized protein DUF4232